MTQGKCIECRVKYEWNTPQRLHDSYCRVCVGKLDRTSCQLHTNESFSYTPHFAYFVWHVSPIFIPCDGVCLTFGTQLCGGMR